MNAKLNLSSSIFRFMSTVTKGVITIVASVLTAGFLSMAVAQTVEDSASVYEFVEAYQNTLNTRNAKATAAFFTEDADLMAFNLPVVHGRQAIENWWRNVWQSKFNRQEPGRKGTFIPSSVRFLADGVALVNIQATTGGKGLQTRKTRITFLLDRQNGNWLISAARGMPTERDSVELIRSLKASESLKPQIRALVSAYEEAFNTHDPAAISAFYTNDADIVVRNSPLIHSRSAILKWWRAYFAQLRPQSLDRNRWFESMRTILIIDKIRMITHDVALINITATAAARQTDAEPPPIRYARATWVIVREESKWLIASLRVLPSEEDRVIRR
jgi:uncharacterized protein (TIGR02246 family)